MNAVGHKIQAPSSIKGRATGASQTKMAFHAPDGGNFKKRYDLIEIRETDKLIQEVTLDFSSFIYISIGC